MVSIVNRKQSIQYKKQREPLKWIARITVLAFLIIILILIPSGELFGFDPDYPDFMWTYNNEVRKITGGTQKAVYLTGSSMASDQKRQDIYRLIEETELNAIVFNAKEDSGYINYNTSVEFFSEIGSVVPLYDIDQVLAEMDERGIYSIARVVLFKDGILTKARPDLAIQNINNGSPAYLDGGYWADIYNQEIWKYYTELVMELAKKGVDEIQFDYIRGPSRGNLYLAHYPSNTDDMETIWAITGFLETVRHAARNYQVKISADVYGFVLIAENDQGIGQLIEELAPYLDYLYPMPYPSHYSSGFLGYSLPEAHPYEVVKYTLDKGLARIGNTDCQIIPWIQAFGLKMTYTEREILLQIKAAEDLGINGFLFWNAGNKYSVVERALKSRLQE
ncbi:MAG: putative glycoside hydrolase [Actinobacteria bacterium]|nr:putative glycoside hydrolase [Actinomycetota bacterium]